MNPDIGATPAPAPAVNATAVSGDEKSYVDWPAILGGAVLATAISFVLLAFGSALGLSFTSAYEGQGMSFVGFAVAAGLWLLWVQVSAYLAGGYLTGRLRRRHYDATEDESDVRDGSHGLILWGVGVIVSGVIAVSGVASAVGTATTAAGHAIGGAAAGAGQVAETVDVNALLSDRLLRTGPGGTPATPEQRDEVARILLAAVAEGELTQAERDYLAAVAAQQAGIDEAEAQARVDQIWAQAEEAEQAVRDAADQARRVALVAGFVTAAALLIGAVAAYFGAVTGGNHRDRNTVVQGWVRPW